MLVVLSESDRSEVAEQNFPEVVDESLFLRNLTLFYLKLQSKLLLPESTIQGIVEEFQNIHDIGQSYFLGKLREQLALLELPEVKIDEVIEHLSKEDLLTACNSGVLSTAQRRKTVFKEEFHYVEPVPVFLGVSERNGKECFAQYVPLKQTIRSLFHCQSVRDQYQQMHSQTTEHGLLRDVKDGKTFSENSLFQTDPSSLGDNLGSHTIGGFVENFSRSTHFCRYCLIERHAFHATPLEPAMKRTPGLPPCLGHDLFEGVVASDVKMFIDYLVNQEKCFTYTELNSYIKQFEYTGNDAAKQDRCLRAPHPSSQVLSDTLGPGSASPSSCTSSSCSSQSSSASSSASSSWPETFKVPLEVMPSGIKLAIANKKRPSPADRRHLVRVLVDCMRKHEVNPSRAQCQIVVQNIIKQYPDSFADILADGTKIGSGYASLLLQVKTRVEHVNRNNTLARRRKERLRPSCGTICQSSRRPADQYGCVRWQPQELPEGENDDSLEEKRKQMLQLHSTEGSSGATRGELYKLMEVTYYRQRRDIYANPPLPVSEVKKSWPYLFCLKGMFLHFHLLTDIALLQRIMESIEGKGKRILRFFQEKPTNDDVRAVLSKYKDENSLVLCLLHLLMAHFKEKSEFLLIEADVAATAADMERGGLPDSPTLIIQGESMSPNKWMLAVEREVVLGPCSEAIVEGLAALFSTYYNLNLAYQTEAACTLEFVQRGIVGINPETGSKVAAGKRDSKWHGMNPNVCTLLRKLMDFEWLAS
ncbi:uncharacterized protein [Misgurnus anguillicaudatus]|uniref:uncharacterized protein n=1 Tax=Misgurnus anguillicaudatus TaxID=75329 RepID=UPI003CCFD3D4